MCRAASRISFAQEKGCKSVGRNVPLDLAPVPGGPLTGQECQRAMARSLEFPVRHGCCWVGELSAGCRFVAGIVGELGNEFRGLVEYCVSEGGMLGGQTGCGRANT